MKAYVEAWASGYKKCVLSFPVFLGFKIFKYQKHTWLSGKNVNILSDSTDAIWVKNRLGPFGGQKLTILSGKKVKKVIDIIGAIWGIIFFRFFFVVFFVFFFVFLGGRRAVSQ